MLQCRLGKFLEPSHLTLELPWFWMEFGLIELSVFTFFIILKSSHDRIFFFFNVFEGVSRKFSGLVV